MRGLRVCVGVDGSIASFRALDAAADEAERRSAELEVVACAGDLDEEDAGWTLPVLRSALDRLRRRHPSLAAVVSAERGDPADVLAARSREAALTVVGTRGLGGFAGLLMQSVSQRLAGRAHGPLLVVRGDAARASMSREPATGNRCVLLGLESDQDADAALFAFEEAQALGLPLHVLHAWTYRQQPDDGGEAPRRDGSASVRDAVQRQASAAAALPRDVISPLTERYPQLRLRTTAVRSTPLRALIVATAAADLVVIAAHRRPHRAGLQLGPVTSALVHHAHCPVAIVPVVGT